MRCTALIVAGGQGRRFGGLEPKQFLPLAGRPLVVWSLMAFERATSVDDVVLVVPPGRTEQVAVVLRPLGLGKVRAICTGGELRVDSVRLGLAHLPAQTDLVAVHDGARPLVTPGLIDRVVHAAADTGAALPVLPLQETVKRGQAGSTVQQTVKRHDLFAAQTPQTFAVDLLRRAYERQTDTPGEVTDDAQLVEALGHPVQMVQGEPSNLKVTVPEDLLVAEALLASREERGTGPGTRGEPTPRHLSQRGTVPWRAGHGFDAHRLVPGRALILGGVTIPHPLGLLGHSDADVLAHALGDALLGAAALGDLGQHFPPQDPRHLGASSLALLEQIRELVRSAGHRVGNVDCTVVCERPRLAPHLLAMRENLARALDTPLDRVSIKATTTEGMGFSGREEGIAAHAVVLLVPAC